MLWVAGVYFVLALVAVDMAKGPGAITNVWFANAAAMAVLATAPRRRWPLLLLAVTLANLAANWLLRDNLLLSASFVPGNLVELGLGAWLLRRQGLALNFDKSPAAFARTLAYAGLLPQVAGASLGAATLQWHGFASFQSAWLGWYVDSTLGALAVLPLALALRQAQLNGTRTGLFRPLPLLFLALTLATVFAAFWYLPWPFVVVALPLVASVFFVSSAATFGLCFVLVLTVCAGLDYGWFHIQNGTRLLSNLFLYLPAAAAVLPAQFLALVVSRMKQLQADTDALTLVGADIVAVFDVQGNFRGLNRAFERTFGHRRDALLGRPLMSIVERSHVKRVMTAFEQARRGQLACLRVERKTAQGLRVLDIAYEPVPDADGNIGRVVMSAHDVTELVHVQRELERTVERLHSVNEGLQQFVRIASHDMREPLNTIAQFCNLVETYHLHELTPDAQQYFQHIGGGAKRMRHLLDDVLSFARLDSGAEVTLHSVPLSGVMHVVRDALAARIKDSQATITIREPLPEVWGNHSLLVLLFQNLVSNGIKFMPSERQPELQIGSRDDGEFVVVTVADNGIGIEAADQAQLFTPFKRLHTRRLYEGTGLGLAICKRIAEALLGTITLQSTPGQGTQVLVRLKRADGTVAVAQPEQSEEPESALLTNRV